MKIPKIECSICGSSNTSLYFNYLKDFIIINCLHCNKQFIYDVSNSKWLNVERSDSKK